MKTILQFIKRRTNQTNKVILLGNLTRDPEPTETNGGIAVCRFAIAVNRPYSNGGEKLTDFFNITAWRTQAENCGKYLKKGSKVAVVGSLQNRSYEDKQGVKRTVTDIIANEVEFLSTKSNEDSSGDSVADNTQTEMKATKQKPTLEPCDDDLPF